MKISRTIVLKTIGILILIFVVVIPSVYLSVPFYIRRDVRQGKQRQVRLLCNTDYHVLLKACRHLSNRVAAGELKPGQYNVRVKSHPKSSQFPQPILDLEPTYFIIDARGIVTIELHGGFLHFGVTAYPEDYKNPFGYEYGDKKLIDGLWYYDETYKGNPDYQKMIDEMIQRKKMQQARRNEGE